MVKEMKYRPKIGGGDFDTKTRKVEQFLGEGHKVKITIMFRGREMQHPELGRRILDRVAEEVADVGRGRDHAQAGRPQHDHGARARQEGAGRRQRHRRRRRPTRRRQRPIPRRSRPRPLHLKRPHLKRPQPEQLHRRPTGTDRTGTDRTGTDCSTSSCRGTGTRHRRLIDAAARPTHVASHHDHRRPCNRTTATPRGTAMPKMKTHRGAKKRFKITGTGKLMRRKANRNHILEKKSATRKRRLTGDFELSKGDDARVRNASSASDDSTTDERSTPWHASRVAFTPRRSAAPYLERAKGYYGNQSRSSAPPTRRSCTRAVRLPRPPGPQGRVAQALDPAHQRGVPPQRHQLQPVHQRPEGWPRSRSTARSSPTSPCTTTPRSPRW